MIKEDAFREDSSKDNNSLDGHAIDVLSNPEDLADSENAPHKLECGAASSSVSHSIKDDIDCLSKPKEQIVLTTFILDSLPNYILVISKVFGASQNPRT